MALCKVKIGLLEVKTISDKEVDVSGVGSFRVVALKVGSLKEGSFTVSSSEDCALEAMGLKMAISSSSSIVSHFFSYVFFFFFSFFSLIQQQDRNISNILKDGLLN